MAELVLPAVFQIMNPLVRLIRRCDVVISKRLQSVVDLIQQVLLFLFEHLFQNFLAALHFTVATLPHTDVVDQQGEPCIGRFETNSQSVFQCVSLLFESAPAVVLRPGPRVSGCPVCVCVHCHGPGFRPDAPGHAKGRTRLVLPRLAGGEGLCCCNCVDVQCVHQSDLYQ